MTRRLEGWGGPILRDALLRSAPWTRRDRGDSGQQPIATLMSLQFISPRRSPILSPQKSDRREEASNVPRHQRHRSADHHHRLAAAAELVHRKSRHAAFPRSDGDAAVPRAVRGRARLLPPRPGDCRPRHPHRRRLPLRRRCRRPELDRLSADAHGGLRARQSAADAGRPRRHHGFRAGTSCTIIWSRG